MKFRMFHPGVFKGVVLSPSVSGPPNLQIQHPDMELLDL